MAKPKIIVIVGPTASGKSALAVRLAKKFKGEIISADSRQVYRGFDIGSGKISKKEMEGIKHYLLDVADPKRIFTVKNYVEQAERAIKDIVARSKVSIIVGGTGFYIQALVDGVVLPEVPPNLKLRKKLERKSAEELFEMLNAADPDRAATIEQKNPRRLIRAMEIIAALGKVPRLQAHSKYNPLFIGIKKEPDELKKLIHKRLLKRFSGIIKEVKRLHERGLSWKRLENFGLEYKYAALYLQKKLEREEMAVQLERAIVNYAKRQMTWFKRDKRIHWIKKYPEAAKLIDKFVKF